MDLKRLVRSKKFLLSSVFVVTILILVGFVWLIYSKDEPKIIPPETRGEIREGVKEEVVKPIESVFPTVGKALGDAAYGGGSNGAGLTSKNTANEIAGWNTYRNEQYGFELKYPEGWAVADKTTEMATDGSLGSRTVTYLMLDSKSTNKEDSRFSVEKRKSMGIDYDIDSIFSDTQITSNVSGSLLNAENARRIKGIAYKFGTSEVVSEYDAITAWKNDYVYVLQYVKKPGEENLSSYFESIINGYQIL
jgi:hypothetical protein